MNRNSLYFTAPETVEIQGETINQPRRDQMMVETKFSAVSPGTELLLYRNQIPTDMPLDQVLETYAGTFEYPVKYGYACVGTVTDVGRVVDPTWVGKTVFTFHPHESHFLASENELIPLPDDLSPEDALFLPHMESAVNFVMDGQPSIGETVAVLGQGPVGLLTTALLSKYPLGHLLTFDRHENRRVLSEALGADGSFEPQGAELSESVRTLLTSDGAFLGADLLFELTGEPAALNAVISLAGYESRVVIGSWYGSKTAELKLGDSFHRNHISLISSQVSRLPSKFTGRWTKQRRFEIVQSMLRETALSELITHRVPFSDAPDAYRLLAKQPEEAIQVIFEF